MPLNIINSSSPGSFGFREMSKNYVILSVSHFCLRAKGDDEILQSIIAKALPTIALHLTKLFNTLSLGTFFHRNGKSPEFWQWKKSCKSLLKLRWLNYWTIRKFEIFIRQIFCRHHSTQSVLIKLTDDICMGKKKKLATLLLQFDFSKAFDNVSPSKLLQKLQLIGFSRSSITWFCSYLSGRSMYVASKVSSFSYHGTNIGLP